jgi:hypothetical protein
MSLAAVMACGGARTPAPGQSELPPLSVFAAQHVVVLPSRYLVVSPSLSWRSAVPTANELLSALDAEISFALKDRLQTSWTFADQVIAIAKKSPGIASDPRKFPADELRKERLELNTDVSDELTRQIRPLVALSDARYVLYPVELRLEGDAQGRGILRAVIIDVRLARVRWSGSVTTEPYATFSNAIAATLASRLADLIATQ